MVYSLLLLLHLLFFRIRLPTIHQNIHSPPPRLPRRLGFKWHQSSCPGKTLSASPAWTSWSWIPPRLSSLKSPSMATGWDGAGRGPPAVARRAAAPVREVPTGETEIRHQSNWVQQHMKVKDMVTDGGGPNSHSFVVDRRSEQPALRSLVKRDWHSQDAFPANNSLRRRLGIALQTPLRWRAGFSPSALEALPAACSWPAFM